MTGLHLSHYAIEAELGRGGMGIVYRAKDTKLNRTVALKVLPAGALASEDDRARFRREAQASAQLNHPNVCHVYQVDEATPTTPDGEPVEGHMEPRLFIAMEYIDGETLHDYVKKGPLKLQEAVNIAGQVAEALKEAHAKDIVHRDIKSANIMLTEGGVAKVLDFGLAKTNQSTMLTRMGSTLGTVAYMSPEQARGQEVDGRSDLYSLGTVLYEMVAGRLPYSGDYEQAVIYGILNEAPEPLTAVRTGVPMQLEWLVNKLLAKEAEYRYQSAAGLLSDLKSLDLTESTQARRSTVAAEGPPKRDWTGLDPFPIWGWALVVAAALGGGLATWTFLPRDAETQPEVRRYDLVLDGYLDVQGVQPSPSGRFLAWSAWDEEGYALILQSMETGERSVLWRTPQMASIAPNDVTFSPDESRVYFESDGDLYWVPIQGGPPSLVSEVATTPIAIAGDGTIYFGGNEGVMKLPGDGGSLQRVTPTDTSLVYYTTPHLLPGERALVYSGRLALREGYRWTMFAHDLEDGRTVALEPGFFAYFVPSGHLVYWEPNDQGGTLLARPFDPRRLKFTGPSVTAFANLGAGAYRLNRQGTMVYRESRFDGTYPNRIYELVDGTAVEVIEGESPFRVSPDGSRIAYEYEQNATGDRLLIFDRDTGVSARITNSGDTSDFGWSPDGSRLVVSRDRRAEIWAADGTGLIQTLPVDSVMSVDWSPDGRSVGLATRAGRVLYHRLDTGTTDRPESGDEDVSGHIRFSPDGQYLAYEARDEDLGSVVRVMPVGGGAHTQIQMNGLEVDGPAWSRDGNTLYVRWSAALLAVGVSARPVFRQTSTHEVVYQSTIGSIHPETGPDGTLFIGTPRPIDETVPGTDLRYTIIVNWSANLTRIAPPAR